MMQPTITMRHRFTVFAALCALIAPAARAQQAGVGDPVVTPVPGFADFLAVDGDQVWTTNAGRVELWSHHGKIASVALPHPCGAMALTAGALWVADCQTRSLNRIDPAKATLTATIPTGIADPSGELNVVAGAGAVWLASAASGEVSRIDPATNTITAKIAVDPGTSYMAFGFGAVWAVSAKQQSLQRIDPATNTVVLRTALGHNPGFLAAGEGAVFVQEQGDGTLARVDPASGTVSGRVKLGATLKWGDIDTGGGVVWLRTTEDQEFAAINPATLAIIARIGKAVGSGALRYTPAGLWTTAHDQHTLTWWPRSAAR